MTSTVITVAIGLLLCTWVLNLIRRGHLYVGYGSTLLILIGGVMCVALVPTRLVEGLMRAAGKVVSSATIAFLAVYCVLLLLIYVLREITTLSRRLRTLTQQLAIELVRHDGAGDLVEPVSDMHHRTEDLAGVSHSRGA